MRDPAERDEMKFEFGASVVRQNRNLRVVLRCGDVVFPSHQANAVYMCVDELGNARRESVACCVWERTSLIDDPVPCVDAKS